MPAAETSRETALAASSGEGAAAATAVLYPVGGTIRGLKGSLSLTNNGVSPLTRSANGSFSFGTPLPRGASYQVALTEMPLAQDCALSGGTGQVASSPVTSVLVDCQDRTWNTGQQLDGSDASVRLMTAAMDDSGTITAVFVKSDGSRQALYATQGMPRGRGLAPSWSQPQVIDGPAAAFDLPSAFLSRHLAIDVSPNGRVGVAWVHRRSCAAPYAHLSCLDVYASSYDPASRLWATPARIGETVAGNNLDAVAAHPIIVKVNPRGDLAVLHEGIRRPTPTTSTVGPTVAWRGVGQAAFQVRAFDEFGSRRAAAPYALGLDDRGGLTLVASLEGSDRVLDLVAWRGSLGGGFASAATTLSTGATNARLQGLHVSPAGEALVVWQQQVGPASVHFMSALSPVDATRWNATLDLGAVPANSQREDLVRAAGGDALLYAGCTSRRWQRATQTWSAARALPANCGIGLAGWIGYASDGSYLHVTVSSGQWRSYDVATNTMAHPGSAAPVAEDYVLGMRAHSTQAGDLFGFGFRRALLAPNGIGAYLSVTTLDQLPTPTLPAGIGRPQVQNLWGFYLK